MSSRHCGGRAEIDVGIIRLLLGRGQPLNQRSVSRNLGLKILPRSVIVDGPDS